MDMSLRLVKKARGWRHTIVIAMALFWASLAANAGYEAGVAAFQREDFAAAQSEWGRSAAEGDLKSQYQLAVMLLAGKHVDKDEARALALLQDASSRGSAEAANALYEVAASKENVKASELMRMLEDAADKGSEPAKAWLQSARRLMFKGSVAGLSLEQESWLPISFSIPSTALGAESLNRGRAVYQSGCVACHVNGILGAPIPGDKARWRVLAEKGIDGLAIHAIRGIGAHPPKGGQYERSNDEVRDAVFYMSKVHR